MGCLSGYLMSPASIQKLFCGICSVFKCSFDEFVGEKAVSPSYSSAILGPPSLFFLMSLAKGLSIWLKEPAFINIYYCFFHFFFICFFLDIYDFFPSTNFGLFFLLLFPVALGVKLGCLFDVFLVS
ncbi:unnamed protein product [Rangifer tarandus platyrhynchus]|uniref:Uncharacterized protein n=1 Tax=Rangifer tarandus platyrhynchus TaxID=3082113 RepID=A0ABN8ZKX6_RANTA|nr:unnamed protein product [Rangifer tarandus platyrhynchus]